MQVINWLALQPLPQDLDLLRERLQEALPLREVYEMLVKTTLRAYPWTGRADLIPCYDPSNTYKQGQRLALPIPDPQKPLRTVWLLGQVKAVTFAENPIQGRFQVLSLEVQGRQIQMVAGIPDAPYPEPDLSQYSPEDLAWLTQWVLDTYAASLQATLRKLIQSGQLSGHLAGETFLPEPVSAISVELLRPTFAALTLARPWISLEGIFRDLPDLAQLERERILSLLRAALKKSPYRSLGGDRWTTPELFRQLNRDVLGDVPPPTVRSKTSTRRKQDEQELAEFASPFLPKEARQALEELGLGEERPALDDSLWRPPREALSLPALNYLQITQAYISVRHVMRAFPPDLQMAFVQFFHGDHEPFLLERETGLLKAVHPERWRSKILEQDLPAGTSLWLEYEGNERYQIAARLLPFKRMVPWKLASMEKDQLHVKHTQMSMKYEGQSALFKAELRSEEIERLWSEASRANHSLREAMIYAMQEICATDPDHRAHWRDLFHAVALLQRCSPRLLSFLLYTQPCFEPLGGGFFRYKPMPVAVKKTRQRNDRLSQLWEDLLSDPVAARPVVTERKAIGTRSQVRLGGSPAFAPDPEVPSFLSEPEISMTAWTYGAMEKDTASTIAVEEERLEPVLFSHEESVSSTALMEAEEPVGHSWKDNLGRALHNLVELEQREASPASEEQAAAEPETLSDSLETAHEDSLSLSASPFRWEPRPAWISAPAQPISASLHMVDPQRLAYRPNVPFRPLHKRHFFQRLFFYLHRWLSQSFGKDT